ncbi:putative lysine decarboxylase [uncultured archaeon]|nr:putative lysine decarboxylase [uncultured archaeon]
MNKANIKQNPFHINRQYFDSLQTADRAKNEIAAGLDLLNRIDKRIVTFFGSHKTQPGSPMYEHCKTVACQLGKQGYAIITGGGTGIMRAANSGAMEAGTDSIGFKAALLRDEQVTEPIYTAQISFELLFVRRFTMTIKSEAIIIYPGGYGTDNELLELEMLMQTGIIDKALIVCVNTAHWDGLFEWLGKDQKAQNFLINGKKDLELVRFADSPQEVIQLVSSQLF